MTIFWSLYSGSCPISANAGALMYLGQLECSVRYDLKLAFRSIHSFIHGMPESVNVPRCRQAVLLSSIYLAPPIQISANIEFGTDQRVGYGFRMSDQQQFCLLAVTVIVHCWWIEWKHTRKCMSFTMVTATRITSCIICCSDFNLSSAAPNACAYKSNACMQKQRWITLLGLFGGVL